MNAVCYQSSIECFYDESDGIVYLHLTGAFDSHSLSKNIDELSTEIEEKVRKYFLKLNLKLFLIFIIFGSINIFI